MKGWRWRHKANARTLRTIWRCLVSICALAPASGCATLGYYAHLAAGEVQVLRARRPIPRVIADPDTSPELRARLQLAQRARAFASDVLKLPRNRSYTTYANIGRPFVMYNVFATPALSLQPVEHCFPFTGCVAYQGFYRLDRAQAAAGKLRRKGNDVWIGGVPAYSTLGHFADPLLSTMADWSDDDLVGTIFHELAHQQVYARDDTTFNESFATFVQRQGLREWHAYNHLPPPDDEADRRERQFNDLVLGARERLKKLYASDLPDTEKLERKGQVFEQLREDYRHLRDTQWHGDHGYDDWFATPLNNAKLLPFGLYQSAVPAFAALFERCGGDWTRFYAAVREIGEGPPEERKAFLGGAQTHEAANR
ncbi:MAG TPA: aminopeptidase [Rhodanobacteraceae bacterium]|nr:aminopeptidase [Rhodanobacteraceae bacterium]